MSNIGIVTTWFERGAAYVSRQIMEQLTHDGLNVFIYARGGESYAKGDPVWDKDYVTWSVIKNSPMPTDIDKKHFFRWIDSNSINTIIFNEQQYWQPVVWAKEKNVKTIAYIDYYKENNIDIFQLYDQLWCNTKRHFSVFYQHLDCRYIPWGTNTDIYKVDNRVIGEKIRFFHSAGMNPYRKGCDIFIEAVFKLSKITNNFECIIHSQVDVQQLFPHLSEKIRALTKDGLLTIINKTVQAPGLYHMGDVYVYPSRLEGIGLTIVEALSCSLPVITTDEPPMNEFVDSTHSRTIKILKRYSRADGYYWPMAIASSEDLTQSLLYFINNFQDIEIFQSRAREFALKNLDWSKNAKKLRACILECKFRELAPSLARKAFILDNNTLPFFNKFLPLYRVAFSIAKKFKYQLMLK